MTELKKSEKIIAELKSIREQKAAMEYKIAVLEEKLIDTVRSEEALWDCHQVAAYLNISESHVNNLRYAGEIPSKAIGGSIRFDPEAIRNYGRRLEETA